MKLTVFFAMICASACFHWIFERTASAQGATTMLQGEWKLDVEATVEELEAVGSARAAEVYQTLTGITVVFNDDGSATSELEIRGVAAPEHFREGSWEALAERHENGVPILEVELLFGRLPHKVRYEFIDRERMRMIPLGDGNATPFRIMRKTR